MNDFDEKLLAERRRNLADTPLDEVLNLAFVYGESYPDRADRNLYAIVWAERLAEGEL
jgi:hypothetical protein